MLHIVPGRDAARGSPPKGTSFIVSATNLLTPENLEADSSVERCASNAGSWESTDAWDWKSLGAGWFLTAPHCRPRARSHGTFHHLVSCFPRNMQDRLLASMADTTTMSGQGKLKLTHSALKERWPTEQKQEMPTAVGPMEETREF